MWFWLMFEKGFFRTIIFGAFVFVVIAFVVSVLGEVFGAFFNQIGVDPDDAGALFANSLLFILKVLFFPSFWDLILDVFAKQYGLKTFLGFLSFIAVCVIGIMVSIKYEKFFEKRKKLANFLLLILGINLFLLFAKGVVYLLMFFDILT